MVFVRGSKYRRNIGLNDIADRTYRGKLYHSILERNHASKLDMLKGAKDPKERVVHWERQVCMPMVINGNLICSLFIDFVVTYGDGRIQYEEVKGPNTAVWSIKKKLFQALYPERKLVVIRS